MSSMTQQRIRPMHWDPLSPASLLLPSTNDASEGDSQQVLRLERFLADDGVGCNDHETSALMKLLDAQEAYFASEELGEWNALKSLSKSYRRALRDCLKGWEEAAEKTSDAEANDEVNLELLKIVYAVTQLSEIYLLMPPSGEYEDTATLPGAVTADTVRYLRLHHMQDAFSLAGDDTSIEDILESSQPEQLAGYWKVVQTLVLRGCLDEAWALLSHHSICRRSFAFPQNETLDEYHAATLAQDQKSFLALRAILLSAPLPGGRAEVDDAGLDEASNEDSESNETHIEEIPRSAYMLWESSGSSVNNDFPVTYNPHAANSAYKTWKRYVKDTSLLDSLTRRVPQMQTILSILRGQFDGIVFGSWSEALCAELLYIRPALRPDDLHVRTARMMEKFGVAVSGSFDEVILSVMKGNAARVIQVLYDLGGGSGAALPATMVRVALCPCLSCVLMHFLTDSLSDLPVYYKKTSLLANLLTEAKLMPSESLSKEASSYCIQTELLLSASQAILSSLTSSQVGIGVRLSTRLLLPHATPDGNVRVTATLGETLERYAPPSDAETRSLLSLCRPLVERKSVRVLDGCVSLILSRYRHCVAAKRPGGAVHWLLRGIDFEKLVYADDSNENGHYGTWQRVLASGICGSFLTTYCVKTSQSLLKGLVESESSGNLGWDFSAAKDMVESIREDDMSASARMIQQVKLLFHVFDIARAIVEGEGDEAIARNIVACLEETPNDDDDGVVAPLAHPSMYGHFLSLAFDILKRDEERYECGGSQDRFNSSFDVNGIHILMGRFTQIELQSDGDFETVEAVSTVGEGSSSKKALCNGLMRAFVSENAEIKSMAEAPPPSAGPILSTKLASYSRAEQERAVELMLDPCV